MMKIKKMLFLTLISLLMACSVEDTSVEESAKDEVGFLQAEAIVQEDEDEETVIVNSNFVGVNQVEHDSGAIVTFDAETGAFLGVILPENCDKDATTATLEVIQDILGEDSDQFLAVQEALANQ